ncbi:sigma-54 interaction domain-containing protein [Tepidibacter aestuarii]|uniref:sigma-54 interaction domain-containing protein n=1 Tax=Tepidibacter aestuarii TaxID=2925782 RepID=UPI0020BF5FBB|nr:sigma 54-interacting transcriptional regulator [Tepidibacter aestuarii]CAH2214589.1 AAA domain family protein [Tepidibacter aestuarii]
MKNRELAIVTLKNEAAKIYSRQIKDFLGDNIKIKIYAFENGEIEVIKEKLVLLSTYLKYDEVKKHTYDDAQIIIPRITLTKSSIDKIRKIEKGKDVLLFNLSLDMSLETISLIYQLGIDHINLIPYYPEMKKLPDVNIAITPGEKGLIKDKVKEVIDIGHRVLELSTIVDVAVKLNLDYLIGDEKTQRYFKNTITNSCGLEKLLGETNKLGNQFDILMKVLDDGIICTNVKGIVYFYSHIARKIINIDENEMVGRHIGEYINEINFDEIINGKQSLGEKLIKINGRDVSFEIKYVKFNSFDGFIIKLKTFSYLEKKQTKLRAQLLKKGHVSKYTFDDIIGISEEINNTKEIAKRMAKSNSSILIIGETGTGKELFAQAVHNESYRKEGPFVAINCGAFQESLLQSELFGYEEGSFTGAKKGGKLGLFEIAHNGTLFLDEIGEMDLNLQAKLLRVIQEKQVRRLGSDRLIDIDVRIIAATNRELKELVKEKKFRKDLYFRLNVLPLDIKPLRQRKEDIILILENIKKSLKSKFSLSNEVEKIFLNYNWEGNVRELKNIIEYLANLDEKIIQFHHLPKYMVEDIDSLQRMHVKESEFKRNESDYIFVLNELKKAYERKERIGRKKIYNIAVKKGVFLSEQEIRSILLELNELELIQVLKGRGGSVINECGLKFLEDNKMG